MIKLTDSLPPLNELNAEFLKIQCLYDCYKDLPDVMFWVADGDKAVISMTDGNMVIYNNGADIEELCEFVQVLSPACVFSDYETLCLLGRKPSERINIMYRSCDVEGEAVSDKLSSKEIYSLLDVDGLSLPEYPFFAVDYCRRINHGGANYFALKDKCAAITFHSGNNAIINGIAAKEKGFGSIALKGIMQKNRGRSLLVCCRDKVKGFYLKNGFKELYYTGYWVKNL